jgi:predicted DNA-binding protein
MKLVGFMLAPEHEENLEILAKELGWSRSRVIRELLAHAKVRTQPSIDVTSGAKACVG